MELVERLRRNAGWRNMQWQCITDSETLIEAADEITRLQAEVERMREANGILEDALQEVGDDYPGSSCQEWCQQQVKAARAALTGYRHD